MPGKICWPYLVNLLVAYDLRGKKSINKQDEVKMARSADLSELI